VYSDVSFEKISFFYLFIFTCTNLTYDDKILVQVCKYQICRHMKMLLYLVSLHYLLFKVISQFKCDWLHNLRVI
jgi:hypothetical protein